MNTKRYLIRDRQTGNVIEHCDTMEQAQSKLHECEESDKLGGIFEPDFYEIYDTKKGIPASTHVVVLANGKHSIVAPAVADRMGLKVLFSGTMHDCKKFIFKS